MLCLRNGHDGCAADQLLALARGPDCRVFSHNGYILNTFRFRTKEMEKHLKTQNSGVVVMGDELSGNMDYYGIIQKIFEIRYLGNNSVILFKCDWFEVPPLGRDESRGYKKDEYGFVSVDVTRTHYQNDPFVLGSQARSVYYVQHSHKENWHTVIRVRPRNTYDLPSDDENELEPYQLNELSDVRGEFSESLDAMDVVALSRDDIEGMNIDSSIIEQLEREAAEDVDDVTDDSSIDESDTSEEDVDDEMEVEDEDW